MRERFTVLDSTGKMIIPSVSTVAGLAGLPRQNSVFKFLLGYFLVFDLTRPA